MANAAVDVKDYPRRLRINVSAVTLAEAMYRAAADVYGRCVRDWPALDPIEKQKWVEDAERVILTMKPKARVIAAITPDAPWGIELDARD